MPTAALRCPDCESPFATVDAPPSGADLPSVRTYVERLRSLILRHAGECRAAEWKLVVHRNGLYAI